MLAERQRLYPAGASLCEVHGEAGGYLLTHPDSDAHPALNTIARCNPASDADTYYFHDLALLPVARGSGRSQGARSRRRLTRATSAGFRTASLVAVNGSHRSGGSGALRRLMPLHPRSIKACGHTNQVPT